ncbi:hypothetical protein BGZ83_010762 [Gryganskiella cystojenkinii]|nr:hypothetical protein BGZ83_010762 [Gryganskiella cystojenkinii]
MLLESQQTFLIPSALTIVSSMKSRQAKDTLSTTSAQFVAPLSKKAKHSHRTEEDIQTRSQQQREQARTSKAYQQVGHEDFLEHPGELGISKIDVDMKAICNRAFVAYETLYSLQTHPLSVTTLTWGSALDISTVRLHYGSTYYSEEMRKKCPVGSCLTAEIRKYGDSATAHEMLAHRGKTQLMEPGESFVEGVNISVRGSIHSMKCLESGHLVTYNNHQGLLVWDMKEDPDAPKSAIARKLRGGPETWDSIHGVEWNPHREHEFMTVSRSTVRIWDRRHMSSDIYARCHSLEYDWIRKAKWSPHHKNVIANLTMEGKVGIWKLDNPEDPEGKKIPKPEDPERLFLHEASQFGYSDFEWCPYIEDVLATAAPGATAEQPGCIQVWRPRNLMSVDDFGEP